MLVTTNRPKIGGVMMASLPTGNKDLSSKLSGTGTQTISTKRSIFYLVEWEKQFSRALQSRIIPTVM